MASWMDRRVTAGRMAAKSHLSLIVARAVRRRRRPGQPGTEPDGVPVEPNRPLDLSGGAAAALTFDE